MKKATWMTVSLAALLPMVGSAAITVNAYAQDGAVAYLYDSLGNTYGDTTFSGGQANIDTSGLVGLKNYGLAVGYAPGQAWYSNIAWADGGGGQQFKLLGPNANYSVDGAVVGAVTGRSKVPGSPASITFSANGPTGNYDNETNELDAQIGLYRPAVEDADVDGTTTIQRQWNASSLDLGFGYEINDIAGSSFGLKMITITNEIGFAADYAASDLGGGDYLMYFLSLDKATAFSDGSIASDGNDVTFTVNNLGLDAYDPAVPYYVIMDRAWMYDDDGNYSEAYDAGLNLTNPDVYGIPEPAVIMLILGGGGVMLGVRRFFMA